MTFRQDCQLEFRLQVTLWNGLPAGSHWLMVFDGADDISSKLPAEISPTSHPLEQTTSGFKLVVYKEGLIKNLIALPAICCSIAYSTFSKGSVSVISFSTSTLPDAIKSRACLKYLGVW